MMVGLKPRCRLVCVHDLKVVANSPERLNKIENPKRYPAQFLKLPANLLPVMFFLIPEVLSNCLSRVTLQSTTQTGGEKSAEFPDKWHDVSIIRMNELMEIGIVFLGRKSIRLCEHEPL